MKPQLLEVKIFLKILFIASLPEPCPAKYFWIPTAADAVALVPLGGGQNFLWMPPSPCCPVAYCPSAASTKRAASSVKTLPKVAGLTSPPKQHHVHYQQIALTLDALGQLQGSKMSNKQKKPISILYNVSYCLPFSLSSPP